MSRIVKVKDDSDLIDNLPDDEEIDIYDDAHLGLILAQSYAYSSHLPAQVTDKEVQEEFEHLVNLAYAEQTPPPNRNGSPVEKWSEKDKTHKVSDLVARFEQYHNILDHTRMHMQGDIVAMPMKDFTIHLRNGTKIKVGKNTVSIEREGRDYFKQAIRNTIESGDVYIEPKDDVMIHLPNNAYVSVDPDGSYKVNDITSFGAMFNNDQRRIFRHDGEIMNFVKVLDQFFEYLKEMKVSQQEALQIPLGLLLNWIIIVAAERTAEQLPSDVKDPKRQIEHIKRPKCKHCGRFISKDKKAKEIEFCNKEHMIEFYDAQMS